MDLVAFFIRDSASFTAIQAVLPVPQAIVIDGRIVAGLVRQRAG